MPATQEMSNETQTQVAEGTPAATVAPVQTPATPETQVQQPQTPESKVLQIPTSAMAGIKTENQERGKTELRNQLDADARALGYESHASLMASVAAAKRQAPATPPAAPSTEAAPAATPDAAALQASAFAEERKRLNTQRADEAAARKKAERALAAREAEFQLRLVATKAGVEDVDYSLHLLKKQLAGKSAEELATFNETEFFNVTLRKLHPHLYSSTEVTVPANTSPATKAGSPPAPAVVKAAAGAAGQIDARKMNATEYADYLKSKGLTPPSIGF